MKSQTRAVVVLGAAPLRRLAADPARLAHVRRTPATVRSVVEHVADLLGVYANGGVGAMVRR